MNKQQVAYYADLYDRSPEFQEYCTKEEYLNEMATKMAYGVDELPDRSALGDLTHGLWSGLTDAMPQQVWGAMRGGNVETPDQQSWWNEFLTNRINENKEALADDLPSIEEAQGSRFRQALRGGAQSLPYSLAVKGVGAVAGGAAGAAAGLTGPGAIVAATAGAGATTYGMMFASAKDQFMDELYDICVTQEGATPEEWDIIQNHVENIATKFGHAEAGPEAVAGMVETALAGLPISKAKLVSKALKATSGKPSVIAKALGAAKSGGKFMGGVALSELPTETLTEKIQQDEWAKIKGEEPISWQEAFTNVAPETIVQSALMGGGISVGRGIARKLKTGDSVNLLNDASASTPTPTQGQETVNTGVSRGAMPFVPNETTVRPQAQPFSPHEMGETSILGGPEPTVAPMLPQALRDQLTMGPLPAMPAPAMPVALPPQGPINPPGQTPNPNTPMGPQGPGPVPVGPQPAPQGPAPTGETDVPGQQVALPTGPSPTSQQQQEADVVDNVAAILQAMSDDEVRDAYQYGLVTNNRNLAIIAATELQRRQVGIDSQVAPDATPTPAPAPTPAAKPTPAPQIAPDQVNTLGDEDLLAVYRANRGKAGPLFIRAALELNKRRIDPDNPTITTPDSPAHQPAPTDTAAPDTVDAEGKPIVSEEEPEDVTEEETDVAPVQQAGYSDRLKNTAKMILGEDFTPPTNKDRQRLQDKMDVLQEEYDRVQKIPSVQWTSEELDVVDAYEDAKGELEDAQTELPLNRLLKQFQSVYSDIQGNPNRIGDAKKLRDLIDETNRHIQNNEAARTLPEEDHRTNTVKQITPKIHEAQNRGLTMDEIEVNPKGAGERYGLDIDKSPRKGHYLVNGRTMSAKQLRDALAQNEENAKAKWSEEVNEDTAKGLARRAVDLDADSIREGAWDIHHVEGPDGTPSLFVVHVPSATRFIFPESELEGVEPAKPGKRGQSFRHDEDTGETSDNEDSIDDIFDEAVSETYSDDQGGYDIDALFDEAAEEVHGGPTPAEAKTGSEKVKVVKRRAKKKTASQKPKKDMTKKGRVKKKSESQLQAEARTEFESALGDAVDSVIDLMASGFKFSSKATGVKEAPKLIKGVDAKKWGKTKQFLLNAWDAYQRSVASETPERDVIKGFLVSIAKVLPKDKFLALRPYVQQFHQEVIENGNRSIPEQKNTADKGTKRTKKQKTTKSGNRSDQGGQTVPGADGRTAANQRPAGYGLRVVDQKNIPKPGNHVRPDRFEIDDNQRLAVNLIIERFTQATRGDDKGQQRQVPRGFGLFDGTGTGKTRTILVAAQEMYERTGKPVLIITKNANIIETSFNRDAAVLGIKVGTPDSNTAIRIGTYEDLIERKVKGETRPANIKPGVYGTILCDEAHSLKNMDSKRTIAFEKLDPDNVVYATATPMDRPEAATYFMSKLSGEDVETINSKMGFKAGWVFNEESQQSEYIVEPIEGFTWDQVYANIIKMRARLNKDGALVRREFPFWGELVGVEEDILTDQEKMDQAAIYNYWQEKIDRLPGGKKFWALKAKMSGARTQNLARWLEHKKAKYIFDQAMKDMREGKSVVIMCETVGAKAPLTVEGIGKPDENGKPRTSVPGLATELANMFDEAGVKYGKVYGAGSKAGIINDFQANKIPCVICSTKSGGTGIDLDDQQGGRPRSMYMASVDWSGDNVDQILGRVSRRNTASPSKIVSVFAKDAFADVRRREVAEKKLTALRAIQAGEDPDLGLLRANNTPSGKPAKKSTDLDGFKDKNPFAEGRVPGSKSVPRNITGFIRELKDAMGMTDIPMAIIAKDDLLDPNADIDTLFPGSVADPIVVAGHRATEFARIMRHARLSTAESFSFTTDRGAILVLNNQNTKPNFSIIGHEFGHVVEKMLLQKASPGTRNAIQEAYKKWYTKTKGKIDKGNITVGELLEQVRGPIMAEAFNDSLPVPPGMTMKSIAQAGIEFNSDYLLSFPEWFADNTAKWLTTDKKALTLADRFFKRVANALRKIAETIVGKNTYAHPDAAVAKFLDEHFKQQNKDLVREMPETKKMETVIDNLSSGFSEASTNAAKKESRYTTSWLRGKQPIDGLFSWPLRAFGMLDDKGRLKLGHRGYDNLKRLVTKAEVPETDVPLLKNLKPFVEYARHGLIDRFKIDKKYIKIEHEKEALERKLMGKVVEFNEMIEALNLDPNEESVFTKILTGEEPTKAEWSHVSEPIRQAIEELGAVMVDLGLIPKESYERNKGKYLHRIYEKYETADKDSLPSWMKDLLATRQSKLIGDETKMRGSTLQFDFSRMADALDGMTMEEAIKNKAKVTVIARKDKNGNTHKYGFIAAGAKVPAGWGLAGKNEATSTYEVRAKKSKTKGKVLLWRDWTPEERKSMGEIMNPRYLLTRTYMLCAHDIATGKFYKDIVDLGTNFVREQKDEDADPSKYSLWKVASGDIEWIKVPDAKISKSAAKKWGALAGKSVRAEIWRDLNELDRLQSRGPWQKFMTWWKLNKTARHPGVHLNQIISNFLFMDMGDVRIEDLTNALKVYKDVFINGNKENPLYKDARDHGAFGGGFIESEIVQSTLKPIMDEILKNNKVDPHVAVEAWAKKKFGHDRTAATLGLLTKLSCGAGDAIKKFDRKALQVYGLEDEVFRLATYIRKIDQGYKPLDAGRYARDQFLNYDIRAPWINSLRRSVLPFASYTYRACPVILKSMMERPWKLAKYFTIGYAFQTMAYALAGADPDEEAKGLDEDISGRTWLGLPRLMRMPWNDDGQRVDLDIRRWIPLGDMFDLHQGDPVLPVPAPLIAGGPVMLLGEFFLNKSAFTGKEIVNPITDTAPEKVAKWADHVYKFMVPSTLGWYASKIYGAATGERDSLGRDYSVPGALASTVGIKMKSRDIQEGRRWKAWDIQKELRELKKQARAVNRDFARKRIDKEKRADLLEDIHEKRMRAREKMKAIR